MLKLLEIVKESLYLPNPDEKKWLLSIEKNEEYSDLFTKYLSKNPVVKEVEVVQYPPDKYYDNTTYVITVHVNKDKIKDVALDFPDIGNQLYFLLAKMFNNSLKLRDKIKYEFHDEEN